MKVLIGGFSSESNEHSQSLMSFDKFIFKYGNELIDSMHVKDLFETADIELIPSLLAIGHPHGPVTKDAFDFILSRFKQEVKQNLYDIDGVFLYLHGASKVLGLEGGSAEHTIIREIRKITGPNLPIAVVMDPHGNLSNEIVENVQILRCYRHSPHIDTIDTYRFVAEKFIELLKNRREIKPLYYRVPIMNDGERSVSFDEPMVSINKLCDEAEQTDRIISASYHIGYIRHDSDKAGNGVVVVPKSKKDTMFAREWALKIRDYAYSRRKDFHFYGNVAEPDEAIKKAVEHEGRPVFITDSGDNVGSGADGFNTYLLRKLMDLTNFNGKNYLVSAIVDQESHALLARKAVGDSVSFDLGKGISSLSEKVTIKGKLVAKGLGSQSYHNKTDIGSVYTVKLDEYPISVIVEWDAIQYLKPEQYADSGLDLSNFDVVVVKQGYISEEFRTISPYCVMAFTEGPTNQKTENLEFRLIPRPMYPFDDVELDEL